MLSTNLNIGSATAAVVAAFHGAANIMREIQGRHQNQNSAAELLAREALMRDALQTAAEQVARAYTIGNETVGPWFGADDDVAKQKLVEISVLISSEVLQSLKIAKEYNDAVLDLESMHEDVILYKRDALKVLQDLSKTPEKTPRYIVRPESTPLPMRSVSRLSTSYPHQTQPSHSPNAVPDAYSPDFQHTHLAVKQIDHPRNPEKPKQQSIVKSSYGSRLFKHRNFSFMRKKQDENVPESFWDSNAQIELSHDSTQHASNYEILPSTAYNGRPSANSIRAIRTSDSSAYSDKIPVDSIGDDHIFTFGATPIDAATDYSEQFVKLNPLLPSNSPPLHDYVREHSLLNGDSPPPAPIRMALSTGPLPVSPASPQYRATIMANQTHLAPSRRVSSPSSYTLQPAYASSFQLHQPNTNALWPPISMQDQIPSPPGNNNHAICAHSPSSSVQTANSSGQPSFHGRSSGPATVVSEIVGRPEKSNNYWGFCKGSWTTREDASKNFRIKAIPVGMYGHKEQWSCKQCSFVGKTYVLGKQKVFDVRAFVDPETTLRYRWLFLAKSHAKCKGVDVSYGCVLCVDEGRKTSIYGNTATLMRHILSEHRTMREDIARKNKVVYGTIVEGQDWDIHFPEEIIAKI